MSAAVERTELRRPARLDVGGERAVASARVDGIALLESEVRELVRRRGVDPMAEPERFAELVREAAADYADRARPRRGGAFDADRDLAHAQHRRMLR